MTLLGLVALVLCIGILILCFTTFYMPTHDNGPFRRNDIDFEDLKLIHVVKGTLTLLALAVFVAVIVGICILLNSVRIS